MKLSSINNLLLGLIILINTYIIAAPLLPNLLFHLHQSKRRSLQHQLESAPAKTPFSQLDHIIIPSMLLDQPILEGPVSKQYDILNSGIWRWPRSSNPDKRGNMVLIGHRFTYTDPRGVFYYLDKVKVGDDIGVVWHNKTYYYKVATIRVVPPNDTSIENRTDESRLTLFTCTPLWWPKNRLVVVANQEQSL